MHSDSAANNSTYAHIYSYSRTGADLIAHTNLYPNSDINAHTHACSCALELGKAGPCYILPLV